MQGYRVDERIDELCNVHDYSAVDFVALAGFFVHIFNSDSGACSAKYPLWSDHRDADSFLRSYRLVVLGIRERGRLLLQLFEDG